MSGRVPLTPTRFSPLYRPREAFRDGREIAPTNPRTVVTTNRGLSGTITLEGATNNSLSVLFEFRPTDGSEPFTRTVTLESSGTYRMTGLPATAYKVLVQYAGRAGCLLP